MLTNVYWRGRRQKFGSVNPGLVIWRRGSYIPTILSIVPSVFSSSTKLYPIKFLSQALGSQPSGVIGIEIEYWLSGLVFLDFYPPG